MLQICKSGRHGYAPQLLRLMAAMAGRYLSEHPCHQSCEPQGSTAGDTLAHLLGCVKLRKAVGWQGCKSVTGRAIDHSNHDTETDSPAARYGHYVSPPFGELAYKLDLWLLSCIWDLGDSMNVLSMEAQHERKEKQSICRRAWDMGGPGHTNGVPKSTACMHSCKGLEVLHT